MQCVWGVHGDAVCPTASQRREKRGERRREKRRAANQQKQKNKREREQSERSERNKKTKQKKQKNSGAIAPCVAVSEAFNWRRSAASVGNVHTNGITPALVSS